MDRQMDGQTEGWELIPVSAYSHNKAKVNNLWNLDTSSQKEVNTNGLQKLMYILTENMTE